MSRKKLTMRIEVFNNTNFNNYKKTLYGKQVKKEWVLYR